MSLEEDTELDKVIEILKNAQTVAIFMHINADCDAMGSSLALQKALISLGKVADVFVDSQFQSSFKVFGNLDFVNKQTCPKYDLSVCLDCSTEARLGKYKHLYKKFAKDTLLIDHHVSGSERYCNTNYERNTSSTAEILFDVIDLLDAGFSQDICKFLLAGIFTDTGKFTHKVSSKTFLVAYRLLSYGKLRVEDICDAMFNSISMGAFNITKLAYQKMEFFCDNRFALLMFKNQDFIDNDTSLNEINGLADLPLQVGSVEIAILASEDDKGYFKVSMRSKGDVSSRLVAKSFGGGGHFNAAGCKIFGEYDEVRQRLIDATCTCLGWKR